jgi:hypothetical protein
MTLKCVLRLSSIEKYMGDVPVLFEKTREVVGNLVCDRRV